MDRKCVEIIKLLVERGASAYLDMLPYIFETVNVKFVKEIVAKIITRYDGSDRYLEIIIV